MQTSVWEAWHIKDPAALKFLHLPFSRHLIQRLACIEEAGIARGKNLYAALGDGHFITSFRKGRQVRSHSENLALDLRLILEGVHAIGQRDVVWLGYD